MIGDNEKHDLLQQLVNGGGGAADIPETPASYKLIDAEGAISDAVALAKVAKMFVAMSPEGRRATLCWLIGYFDPPV